MASFFSGKKKYGAAEKAVDPKFEDAREHVAQLSAGVAGMQQALGKLRAEQFHGLSEPAAAMRNFYQDEGRLSEQCSDTLRAMDDALVAYNADHQRAAASVGAVADALSGLRRAVDARDAELVEYHRFRAAVAAGRAGPDADERERQLKASFDACNEQTRRDAEAAHARRAETFHDSYNQVMAMFATLFGSLSAALAPLAAAIPDPPPVQQQQQPHQPPPKPKPAVPAAATVAMPMPPTPPPKPQTQPPVPSQQQQPPTVPPKPTAAASTTPQQQPAIPPKPAKAVAPAAAAAADEVRRPVVPEPVYTDDMDDEMRAIVRKRYEQDKLTAEQKYVMQRKRRELEEQMRLEKQQRAIEDRKLTEDFERVVREHENKIKQVDRVEETEKTARTKRFQEFSSKENEKHQHIKTNKLADNAARDAEDDRQRALARKQADEEKRARFEQWKRDEEERMRRELAAKIRAHEEKERLDMEEIAHRRQEEDRAIMADRVARDRILNETAAEEASRKIGDYESSMRREQEQRTTALEHERAQLRAKHEEAASKHARDLEALRSARAERDLAMADAIAKVTREIEDLERQEQREKVRRVQDDIERVERKERERRDQDDKRRAEELERIRRRQAELEEAEKLERERREREDRERAAMRQRLISGGSEESHATSAASATPPPAKPLPTPAAAQASPEDGAPHKQLPTPPPAKPLPSPAAAAAPAPAKPEEPAFDVANISPEQLQQYVALFAKADADHNGLVGGAEAKVFFGKSGLPFDKLGKIWSMADLDKDNKLNLMEFCIAIHLVYASLRGIALPASLPPSLKASATQPQIL